MDLVQQTQNFLMQNKLIVGAILLLLVYFFFFRKTESFSGGQHFGEGGVKLKEE